MSGSLHLPLASALLLSAAAHAAMVFIASSGDPLAVSMQLPASQRDRPSLRASLAPMHRPQEAASVPQDSTSDASVLSPAKPKVVHGMPVAPVAAHRPAEPIETADASTLPDDGEAQQGPSPLTYPVISLPSNDDPHRIGLVRLLLVVSSEGRVAQTIVTATTMSQDYVDRIAQSFQAVQFKPASAHGFPRAGWYEVVVNFDFDPDARSTL